MPQTISVPSRFNGPLTSGHGVYSSGVIAAFVKAPVKVTLRSPVPLDTPLEVIAEDQSSVRMQDGETLVAEARSVPELAPGVPEPVSVHQARRTVLDCPTYFAVYSGDELPVSFLGRLAARIEGPVMAGDEHVLIAWPIGTDNRKREAGAAVVSAEGAPLAVARALMIEPREQPAP